MALLRSTRASESTAERGNIGNGQNETGGDSVVAARSIEAELVSFA
jgi:hypothetical protein